MGPILSSALSGTVGMMILLSTRTMIRDHRAGATLREVTRWGGVSGLTGALFGILPSLLIGWCQERWCWDRNSPETRLLKRSGVAIPTETAVVILINVGAESLDGNIRIYGGWFPFVRGNLIPFVSTGIFLSGGILLGLTLRDLLGSF